MAFALCFGSSRGSTDDVLSSFSLLHWQSRGEDGSNNTSRLLSLLRWRDGGRVGEDDVLLSLWRRSGNGDDSGDVFPLLPLLQRRAGDRDSVDDALPLL